MSDGAAERPARQDPGLLYTQLIGDEEHAEAEPADKEPRLEANWKIPQRRESGGADRAGLSPEMLNSRGRATAKQSV